MKFSGTWHIYEMEAWDEDYFNMELQAYIKINNKGIGEFQFGLVRGKIDGEVIKEDETEVFEFTWEGTDEYDPDSGAGRMKLIDNDIAKGKIMFHLGDNSEFSAKRFK